MMKLDNKTIPLLQKELTRLTSITEQIMEYEHLTSHYTDDIHVEKFLIKEQLESLIHEYTPQIERTGQHIFILGEDAVNIRMDLNMFIQIIHNIFSNFIKYAGEDTILNCNYIQYNDTIEIIFSDDGIGIPEEEINLVHEKFYRVDKARTHNGNISM
jgi:signal transduction histidine kinase